MKVKYIKSAVAGLVLSVSGFANAGLIEFSDRASFEAVTDVLTTIDFEDNGTDSWNYNTNYVEGNAVITPTFDYQYHGDYENLLAVNNPWHTLGSDFLLGSGAGHTIRFSEAIKTFGLDFGVHHPDTVTFTLSSGEQFLMEHAGGQEYNFFGVISDIAFNSVSWSSNSGSATTMYTDNISYNTTGPTSTVPEPSTLAIFALGIMGLASRRFKKQS